MPHTIAENLTRLSNAKDAIAAAIVDKGGTIEAGDGFESFADKIEAISGGGGVLISKNITENGTYNASDDSADGYSNITVQTQGQLIDPSKALIGYELDVSGGGEHSNSKGYVTDYIDVENFSKIFVRRYGSWTHAYFYDANKNAIQTVTSNDKITVPQGAKYYRLNDQVERVSDDIIIGLF